MATKPSEKVAVLGVIDPDANGAGALTSDYGDAAKFEQLMAVIMAGTLGTNATIDAKLVQATDASGTGVKDITGKAITQLTEAGTDSDKQAIIQVRADELDVAGGFRYVAIVMTTAVATSDSGAILLGLNPAYGPANSNDLASVDEIVG
jgi:hypothetical protein